MESMTIGNRALYIEIAIVMLILSIFVIKYSIKKIRTSKVPLIKNLAISNIVILSLWAVLVLALIAFFSNELITLEDEVLVNGSCCAYLEYYPSVWFWITALIPVVTLVISVIIRFLDRPKKTKPKKQHGCS